MDSNRLFESASPVAPNVRKAIEHSDVVAPFGDVEIRKVRKDVSTTNGATPARLARPT